MATEAFKNRNELTAQGRTWAALTPSDTVDFDFIPKAIHNCTSNSGTFVAVGEDDVAATFYAAAGDILPIRPKRINSTSLGAGLAFTGLKT